MGTNVKAVSKGLSERLRPIILQMCYPREIEQIARHILFYSINFEITSSPKVPHTWCNIINTEK